MSDDTAHHVRPADAGGRIMNPETDEYLPPEGVVVRRWTPYWRRLEARGGEIIVTLIPPLPDEPEQPADPVDLPRRPRLAAPPAPKRASGEADGKPATDANPAGTTD